MPKLYVITEVDLKSHNNIAYHYVTIPYYGEKEFYRIGVSLEYFAHGITNEEKRKGNYFKEGVMFHCQRADDLRWKAPKTPDVMHASLWDFYTAVGYNYKKKKAV